MTVCSCGFEKYTGTCFKENYFSLKLFKKISFKVDSIALDPDPDPNWAKILDPDPNSMYSIWIHNTGVKRFQPPKIFREVPPPPPAEKMPKKLTIE